jgi:hypothetical protein
VESIATPVLKALCAVKRDDPGEKSEDHPDFGDRDDP